MPASTDATTHEHLTGKATKSLLVRGGVVPYRLLTRYKAPLQLKGRRVSLRTLVTMDYEAWRDVQARCRDWLATWKLDPIGGPHEETEGRASFAVRCAKQTRSRRLGTSFAFGIFVSDRFAGYISLFSIERGAKQSAEIGYWVDQQLAGQGLAPEAVTVLLRFAFERLGLHRVQFSIGQSNTASRRVVEKIGLRCEGQLQRYVHVNDAWEDRLLYAITAEEWEERRQTLLDTWLHEG